MKLLFPQQPPQSLHAADRHEPTLSDRDLESNIEAIQGDLRGYIISLSGHSDDCDDVLQETNIFLWERKDDFKAGSNFKAWAFKVAYFKSMASRRDSIRRGEVVFSEAIAQRISSEAEAHFEHRPDKLTALGSCLKKLKSEEYQLLQEKYINRNSLTDFAQQIGKSSDAVHKAASRLRLGLKSCIEQQLLKG